MDRIIKHAEKVKYRTNGRGAVDICDESVIIITISKNYGFYTKSCDFLCCLEEHMAQSPKIIAFHLPQYHTFPENDEWWGKGFTDWNNVKKAKPLFKRHYQPRVPLNNNYYNMMDYETRKWQAETAKKYGLYGFCYYHYWFNGKLLMEKPLEALLEEKDIDFPFCLCWANEPWTRAWDGGDKDIIMPQQYGDKADWEKHINYLINFFKDDRYIKVNNKPMMVIYRTDNVDECDEMIQYWNNKCNENGFSGIYVIEEVNSFQFHPCCKMSEAYLDFAPWGIFWSKKTIYDYIDKIRKIIPKMRGIKNNTFYDTSWKRIINRKYDKEHNKQHYLGAFVGWDNTPRNPTNGLVCLGDSSPKAFGKFFSKLYKKAINNNAEYIFINAWNEWAEGAYLEPDEKYGYGYLEQINTITNNCI